MLVVSRRPNDSIVFPNLGISVHVVRIEGRSVRLGIQAPRDVRVLRHEIAGQVHNDPPAETAESKRRHETKNRLNTALLGLHLIKGRLEAGTTSAAELLPILERVTQELHALDDKAGREPAPVSSETAMQRRRTALVVEDNANECELLAAYLRMRDFEVATARDGADALDYLSHHNKPDVILLDMNLPRMNGDAMVQQIRSDPAYAGLKVFVVSGLSPVQSRVKTGPQGVDRWFTKPIRPDALIEALNQDLAATPLSA